VDHVLQQRDTRQLNPVQVVDHDGQRSVLRHAAKRPRDGLEPGTPADAGRIVRRVATRDMAVDVRRQSSQIGSAVTQHVGQAARISGQEELIEHLDERLVGNPRILGGVAHQHRDVPVVQGTGELGRQSALAGTGLPAQQDDLAVALHHALPHGLHDLELVATTDDPNVTCRGEPRGQGNRDPRRHARHGTDR
jgi:hypothetical protein